MSQQRLMEARAYVQSRFFPPLPVEYGDLAVQAVDAVNGGYPFTLLDVSDLDLQPRGTVDGKVTALHLVEVLHLIHLLDTDDEDDVGPYEVTPSTDGCWNVVDTRNGEIAFHHRELARAERWMENH